MVAFAKRSVKPPELLIVMGEEETDHPMTSKCDFLGKGDGERFVLVGLEGSLCSFLCVPSKDGEVHLESQMLRRVCSLFTGAEGLRVPAGDEFLAAMLNSPRQSVRDPVRGLKAMGAAVRSTVRRSDGEIGELDRDIDNQWWAVKEDTAPVGGS